MGEGQGSRREGGLIIRRMKGGRKGDPDSTTGKGSPRGGSPGTGETRRPQSLRSTPRYLFRASQHGLGCVF